jgi:hypothetical protein
MVIGLVMAGRFEEAVPHLREVVLRKVERLPRIDLKDAFFEKMKALPAFKALELEVSRQAGDPAGTPPR